MTLQIARTPHPRWLAGILDDTRPAWNRVVEHEYFEAMASGRLTRAQFHDGLVYSYPLIETFPRYMALTLTKVPPGDGGWAGIARRWLLKNMNVERVHAELWRQWAAGFGVEPMKFDAQIHPPAAIDAINNYLWRVCSHGTLVEAMAATNYAIEGATGEWTRHVVRGLRLYEGRPGYRVDRRSVAWVKAHADYDDAHPWEALEIIKAFVKTEEQEQAVKRAIARSLEYYALSLDSCLGADGTRDRLREVCA
jgi:pyrroloquinoline quinone (PQQ) biosynthesis protein C